MPPTFGRHADQATPERTKSTDFDHAADSLSREHEALANMQGAESRRVDRLVDDVGAIKGNVQSLQGDMSRVASGVDQLQQSMIVLSRHAVLMETQSAEIAQLRNTSLDHERRIQESEKVLPPLVEMRKWMVNGMLGALGLVGLALLGLVIKGSP